MPNKSKTRQMVSQTKDAVGFEMLPRPTPDPASNWPRGWWMMNPDSRLGCVGSHDRDGHRIENGQPIYLSGEPGDVFGRMFWAASPADAELAAAFLNAMEAKYGNVHPRRVFELRKASAVRAIDRLLDRADYFTGKHCGPPAANVASWSLARKAQLRHRIARIEAMTFEGNR